LIRGQPIDIGLQPIANKNVDEFEAKLPIHIDIRNGRMTDAGGWERRPGYGTTPNWTLPVTSQILTLIPDGGGLAIAASDSQVYDLPTASAVSGTTLNGSERPQWVVFKPTDTAGKLVIIVDGGTPIVVDSGTTRVLGGSPSNFKFIDSLDTYAIGCGHNDIDFRWSKLEKAEEWPEANFNSVLGSSSKGAEKIRHFLVFNRGLYFFKNFTTEVWSNTGSDLVFERTAFVEKGCGADYSVVLANQNLYWFGDDGDFYQMQGFQPVVISSAYRKELDKLTERENIYGFDFRKEAVIRWFSPADAKTFVYDYRNNIFSEDNLWDDRWKVLPINAYMEMDGKAYIGDRDASGKIYEWSRDFDTDGSLPIRMYRRFSTPISPTGNTARINRLRFRVKRGTSSAVSNPKAIFRWRMDRGDYNKPIELDLGNVGDEFPYIDLYNVGIGAEIEVELIETDSVDFIVSNIKMHTEELLR